MIHSTTLTNTSNAAANRSLDIYAKVERIARPDAGNAAALVDALNVDKATLSGVGQLQNMLANFQGVVHSLAGKGLDLFATATSPGVLEANTSGAAVTGKYEIQVKQLAQSQVLQSQALTAPDAAIGSFGASKLSIEFGTLSQSGFSSNTVKSIPIPAGENTLQGVSDAINRANVGIAARLVPMSDGVALEIVSPSGASNSMRIGVSGDAAMQTLLGYDPFGAKALTEVKGAQDAVLTVNGEAVNSFSNTVKFGVPGTTLHLKATGSTALVIEQGSTQIEQNVAKFVDAYNLLNAQLKQLERGELSGDGSASHIRTQLEQALSASDRFAGIGVTMQSDGSLSLDRTKLQDAVSKDAAAVTRLFGEGGQGLADNLGGLIQGFIGPIGSLSKKMATITKAISALNAERGRLEQAQSPRTNPAVEMYAQQQNSSSNWTGTGNPLAQLKGSSLRFDFPA